MIIIMLTYLAEKKIIFSNLHYTFVKQLQNLFGSNVLIITLHTIWKLQCFRHLVFYFDTITHTEQVILYSLKNNY